MSNKLELTWIGKEKEYNIVLSANLFYPIFILLFQIKIVKPQII